MFDDPQRVHRTLRVSLSRWEKPPVGNLPGKRPALYPVMPTVVAGEDAKTGLSAFVCRGARAA